MEMKDKHPCFSNDAAHKYARLHLPVAPVCNIRCNFCEHKGCVNEHRPGLSMKIMKPDEVLEYVEKAVDKCDVKVIAVAGTGDSLANKETFESLRLVHEKYSHLNKCISTNGLLLAECVPELKRCGVNHISITVNAVNPETAAQIYESINGESGIEAVKLLIEKQKQGVEKAVRAGILIKINTVLIPGVNDHEVEEIAKYYGKLGARIMNIVPLIPLYKFKSHKVPGCDELNEARNKCEPYIKQFRMCQQCRSDSVGLIKQRHSIFKI